MQFSTSWANISPTRNWSLTEGKVNVPNRFEVIVFFKTTFAQMCRVMFERDTKSHARHITFPAPPHTVTKDSHNTGNYMPYSFRIVCGFFNVPHCTNKHGRYCETGPTVYSPYPKRHESLTICWCNYKGNTFYSVILRPWVMVRPESNSRPPAWQTDSHLTEPPVRGQIDYWKSSPGFPYSMLISKSAVL